MPILYCTSYLTLKVWRRRVWGFFYKMVLIAIGNAPSKSNGIKHPVFSVCGAEEILDIPLLFGLLFALVLVVFLLVPPKVLEILLILRTVLL